MIHNNYYWHSYFMVQPFSLFLLLLFFFTMRQKQKPMNLSSWKKSNNKKKKAMKKLRFLLLQIFHNENPKTKNKKIFILLASVALSFLLTLNAILRVEDSILYSKQEQEQQGKLVLVKKGTHAIHITCKSLSHSSSSSDLPSNTQQNSKSMSITPPTIVLDSGLGIPSSASWSKEFIDSILLKSGGSSRVCIYDRPGYGKSETGPLPQTSLRIAESLHEALHGAGEKGPFVLVGHSFGGFNMRVYAHGIYFIFFFHNVILSLHYIIFHFFFFISYFIILYFIIYFLILLYFF